MGTSFAQETSIAVPILSSFLLSIILLLKSVDLLCAGIFVLGMGAGITVDTVLNVEPNNVASREVIDRQTPNPDVCIANGMSAMVLDQRLFISFNP